MDIQKLNKAGRLSEWAQMISQCHNSGLSVSAWCAEHGINVKTYYYRLKRVCEAIPEETKQARLPLPKEAPEPVFAEVSPSGRHTVNEAVITVRFSNVEMVIHNGAERAVVEAALQALSRIC